MESNPFPNFKIDSSAFLDNIEGRTVCDICGKSRKYYCYTCYKPLGGKEFESRVPKVKLPIKIDVIKHPQEVDGKSTAVHAAVLAPDDVTVYTYPAIPDYPDKSKVLLVYPGSDSISFEDFVARSCPLLSQTTANQNDDQKELDTNLDCSDGHELDTKLNTEGKLHNEQNQTLAQEKESCSVIKDNDSLDNRESRNDICDNKDNICSSKRTLELLNDKEDVKIKKKRDCSPLYKCTFSSVIFIDSTWHSVHKISIDERLKGIQKIELKSQTTKFWRHQQDKPDTYLATVEAIYYFLREYHEKFIASVYNGEYDNLLFYFVFMYGKIRYLYEGGKSLKAYNKKKT